MERYKGTGTNMGTATLRRLWGFLPVDFLPLLKASSGSKFNGPVRRAYVCVRVCVCV